MVLASILFLLGLIVVSKAADYLVEGSASIALRANIAPIVVGLTIVAFGTSAPELVVSVTGALAGSTDLAFGNVVGSNIFNVLGILGISAVIYPLRIHSNTVWKEIPMSLLGAAAVFILGLQAVLDSGNLPRAADWLSLTGTLTFSSGLILLLFFVIFLYYTFGIAKINGSEAEAMPKHQIPLSLVYIIGGLVGLAVGSRLVVDNAVQLAELLGMSQKFIALTLVSIGTSLPELATCVAAARKKQADIIVGNVVGSNIFNLFLILGTTSLFTPITMGGYDLVDLLVMVISFAFLFACTFIIHKKHVGRWEGIIMLAGYFMYLVFLFAR